MTNGSLSLSFTDLVLPGNAGMNLSLGRSYVRQGGLAWTFGIQGVPTRVVYPDGFSGSCCNPEFYTFDGSKHTAYPLGTGAYLTKDLWRYTPSTRKLEMPNGWTVSFESGTNTGGSMMTAIEDVFGNRIDASWNDSGSSTSQRPLTLASVTQTLGTSETRTVTFEYATAACPAGMPSKMTYGDREWNYACEYGLPDTSQDPRLTGVTPPTGPGWAYSYEGDLTTGKIKVTTPNGGWVRYEFQDMILPSGSSRHHPVVKTRDVGGRDIASAAWNFSFVEDSPGVVATVTLPGSDSRSVVFAHEPTGDGGWFLVGKTLQIGTTSPTPISSLTRTRRDIPFVAGSGTVLTVPDVETIVQDGRTYKRTYAYNYTIDTGYTNYGDYGQAFQITEEGEFTRVTTRTFDSGFSIWLANRIDSVTVQVGAESFSDTWNFDTDTGFLDNQTIRGVYTAFAPDAHGNVGSVTNGNSHTTTFTYDWGTLKNTTTQEGHVTSRTINSDGSVESQTADGYTTEFDTDRLWRVTETRPPLVGGVGDPTDTAFDLSAGTYVTVSRGPTSTTTSLDGFGRPRGTENAVGMKTTVAYDADGRVIFQSQPFTGSSGTGDTISYDTLSRVSSITHADSTVTNYTYGSVTAGATVTTTDVFSDSDSHVRVETWARTGAPSGGRLASVVDAEGGTWSYSYNALDLLTQVSQPGSSTRTYHYFSTGQLEYETHPESGTVHYTYDGAGNIATRIDAASQTLTYSYDGDERLTDITTPVTAHNVTQDVHNTRNLRTSLVTGPTSDQISTTFSYDAAGRLAQRVDTMGGHSFSTTFEYDGRDNLTKLTYPSGREIVYAWDNADRLDDVFQTSGPSWATDFSYDPSGAVAGYVSANGQNLSITYDAVARPHVLTSGPLSLTYTYWQSGNVKDITDGRGSSKYQAFGYDKLDRLTGATGSGSGTFTYDPLGNRASKNSTSYTYTGARLTNDGATAYTFDNNGNTSTAGSTTFGYTPFDMPSSATTGGVTTTYRYDGDGERRMRTTGTTTAYFIPGVGFEPLAEYTEVGGVLTLVREYIYANGRLVGSEGLTASPIPSLSFTDEPLVAGTTMIKAVHLAELRSAVNAARAIVGLSAATWTDPGLTIGTPAKAAHITELRSAIADIYTALGWTPPTYTDPTLTVGTTLIKAVDVEELRTAYTALATGLLRLKAFYHLDSVGSVRAITDIAGNPVEWHDYTAFGEETTSTSGIDTRRFGGKERDVETGLNYFNARYYSPSIGRFARADEPGFGNPFDAQSMNQYGYTSGNPLRWVDPTGHDQCPPGSPPGAFCSTGTGNAGASASAFWAFFTNFLPTDASNGPLPQASNIKSAVCRAIPSGRTEGISGGVGGLLSFGAGGELVLNYDSGQVSAFGFGGAQAGWNGGASGSVYTGFVSGLDGTNSNYAGGFSGFNLGQNLGIFWASSSGGLSHGVAGLAPNGAVKAAGISLGVSLTPTPTGGFTGTNYSQPRQLGKFWAFGPLDALLYAARQACK